MIKNFIKQIKKIIIINNNKMQYIVKLAFAIAIHYSLKLLRILIIYIL